MSERQLKELKALRQNLADGIWPRASTAVEALDWAIQRLGESSTSAKKPASSSRPTAEKAPGKNLLYADGGSRGNPGPAAWGFVILGSDGGELARGAEKIGRATNNVAEYSAVIVGLERAVVLGLEQLEVRLDSQLVVRQLTGQYKAKHPKMAELRDRALRLARQIDTIRYIHIPREQNKLADALVNAALDGKELDLV
ncbi:ribonuclease HI family protein [bacterium]|nr:ribonuclease HI family protein [bacterium]